MDIVIVGAGPAGLFLAYRLLALSSNYKVQLYERNQNPNDIEALNDRGFGLGLGTRVQHWLDSIDGLVERLSHVGIQFTPDNLLLIPRLQLCALLLDSLLTQYGNQVTDAKPRFSIAFNTVVTGIDLDRHEIRIEKASGSETVTYDLLVGADGIHSTVRHAMILRKPEAIDFQQRQRPQIWKVLQLPMQSEQQHLPRIIQLHTRRADCGLIFGGCLPKKEGGFSALIFWQPTGSGDQMNPRGITTVEELQELWQEMSPKHLSDLRLDRNQAELFLAAQPGHEYWSQCRYYHDLAGRVVLIGDAAHGMFSLLGQGCTAAISDAVTLVSLLQKYPEQWSIVLPQFSTLQVKEGHAASDLSLLAFIFYNKWLGLFYKLATLLWVILLRQPSIFTRLNQVNATYAQVLQENRLWMWLANWQSRTTNF